jgi:histidine triad (HIT) family protein
MRLLLALARTRAGGIVARWTVAHAARLPLDRLVVTDQILAFRHPVPSYPVHIIIVPKRPLSGVQAISTRHAGLLADVLLTARGIARDLGLDEHGYTLLVNGGAYQEVGLLHFHLIACPAGRTRAGG